MAINIDKLTEAELIDLNNRIVERLRFLHQMRAHAEMLEFRIGDRVEFQPQGRALVTGMLTRYNRKTVTVVTDTGEHWNVAPRFLRRAGESASGQYSDPSMIRPHKK
jgi:ribosomal protein S17